MPLTQAQREAVNPKVSAWVEASAGSGKTRVLVDRLLTLMVEGADPDRLLCLTFTKAAAAEMESRLKARLSSWSLMDHSHLENELKDLGLSPTPARLACANGLFRHLLNLSHGMRIQTLHSFCENLLRRFPLEAGVMPAFRVMDEHEAQELFRQNFERLLTEEAHQPHLRPAVHVLSDLLNYEQLYACLWTLSCHRRFSLKIAHEPHFDLLKSTLKLEQASFDAYIDAFLAQTSMALYKRTLTAISAYLDPSPTFCEKRDLLTSFVLEPSARTVKALTAFFLTKEGEVRKTFIPSALARTLDTKITDFLALEAIRFVVLREKEAAYEAFESSQSLVTFFWALERRYERAKREKGVVDYEDLILKTKILLKGGDDWIAYKVDSGIDHILVDEAQDTSRLQWQVIVSLMDIFFESDASFKTLFVVGDPKQSIYSFQGADPDCFREMRDVMEAKLKTLGRSFKRLSLQTSFRAVPKILSFVDSVFECPSLQRGVGGPVTHDSYGESAEKTGSVTVWPLLEVEGEEEERSPSLPPHVRLAFHTAMHIKELLEAHLWLARATRVLKPSDVMVLVRKRSPFVDALARFLRGFNVPVMGQDRLRLNDTLAVQDLLALAKFCLTPQDDLTLAALLKSPLVGLSEERLFQVCRRPAQCSVWEHIQKLSDLEIINVCATLRSWMKIAHDETPLNFFTYILWEEKGTRRLAERLGQDVFEVVEGFLTLVRQHEPKVGYSLLALVALIETRTTPIKRDPDAQTTGVRILTIHGAKGLEAPFVILPETSSFERPAHTLLFLTLEDVAIPFFPKNSLPSLFKTAASVQAARETDEGSRLLYVALTRACEHLLVGGLQKKRSKESWYQSLAARIYALDVTRAQTPWGEDGTQSGSLTYKPTPVEQTSVVVVAPIEPFKLGPLNPVLSISVKTPSQEGVISKTPAFSEKGSSDRYGRAVHAFLAALPQTPKAHWESVSQRHYSWIDLPKAQMHQAFREACGVLNNPKLDFLNDPAALREVPFSYLQSKGARPVYVTGRMDFVWERTEDVWCIDFKTGLSRPQNYGAQMSLYKSALQRLYAKPLRVFLLWTKTHVLEAIDE